MSKRKWIFPCGSGAKVQVLLLLMVLYVTLLSNSSGAVAAQSQSSIVESIYFSPLPLKQYERVSKIEAELSCGHFSDFNAIPEDWSLSLVRPISGAERLKMEAGHGASQLSALEELDGIIGIMRSGGCFSLKIFVTKVTEVLGEKRMPLKETRFKLVKSERPHRQEAGQR